MADIFSILPKITEKWPSYPKDEPFPVKVGSRSGFAIAFEVDGMWVLFAFHCGERGGRRAAFTVVDQSQTIEADRLLCHSNDATVGYLLDEFRFGRGDFAEGARRYLVDKMRELKGNANLVRTLSDEVGFGSASVIALPGGSVNPR